MPSGMVKVAWGHLPRRNCKLCANAHTNFATLVDMNGHKWLICADCVNNLWAGNQATITEERIQEAARQLLQDRLLGSNGD